MSDDPTIKTKIKSLILKGFNKEEIKSLLSLDNDKLIIRCIKDSQNDSIDKNSSDLYSELQKDLNKLVFTEMQKDKDKRDPGVILNAVKLQAELQEKKLILNKDSSKVKTKFDPVKVSKDYIYERDKEIAELKNKGVPNKEIMQKFGISDISILWAMDRVNLNFPEHLKQLSPTTINETRGLSKEDRIKVLQQALDNKWTKLEVRNYVNSIKNNDNHMLSHMTERIPGAWKTT